MQIFAFFFKKLFLKHVFFGHFKVTYVSFLRGLGVNLFWLLWKTLWKRFWLLWKRSWKVFWKLSEKILGPFWGHRRNISFPMARTTQKKSRVFREVSGWFSRGFRDGFRDSFRDGFWWQFSWQVSGWFWWQFLWQFSRQMLWESLLLIDILVKGFLLCFPAFVRLRLSAAQHFRPWPKGNIFSNINVVRMSGSKCLSIGGNFGQIHFHTGVQNSGWARSLSAVRQLSCIPTPKPQGQQQRYVTTCTYFIVGGRLAGCNSPETKRKKTGFIVFVAKKIRETPLECVAREAYVASMTVQLSSDFSLGFNPVSCAICCCLITKWVKNEIWPFLFRSSSKKR